MRDLEHIITERIVDLERTLENDSFGREYRHTVRTRLRELRFVLAEYDRENGVGS